MHVLIIPSWYKTKDRPVVGSFFEEQARALINIGYKVGILFPTFIAFSSKSKVNDYYEFDNGIPTYYCGYKCIIPKNHNLNYKWFGKRVFKTYLKYVKENGVPDIIHAHTIFYAGIAANYISEKTKIPLVITEHYTSFITGGIHHKADFEKAKAIYSSSKCNLVVSRGFRHLLANKLQISETSFSILPNMVDARFFEKPITKVIDKDKPVFFTMSFLTERKNHKLMFDAFSLLLKQIPNALFKIGGDGIIRPELELYVQENGIKDNVIFLGELPREEVVDEMSKCDVFLLASKFETFGVVLIEALACGKPIITTDSIGPRDIVTSGNGVIVPKFEPESFCQAILKMIDKYETYNPVLIRQECKNRFSEAVVSSELKKIYSSVLSDNQN